MISGYGRPGTGSQKRCRKDLEILGQPNPLADDGTVRKVLQRVLNQACATLAPPKRPSRDVPLL